MENKSGVKLVAQVEKKAPSKAVAPKKIGGRKPFVLDEDKESAILDFIRIGTPVKHAVVASGVSEAAFYNAMSRGLAERERLKMVPNAKENPTEVGYLQFLESVERARSEAVAKKVASITKAAIEGDWRASAWWLERQVGSEFGKTDRIEIGGQGGEAIKVQIEMGDLEDKIARILSIREK